MKRIISAFNILAVLSGLLMIEAVRLPWWSITIGWARESDVYPYGIYGPAVEIIGYRKTQQMTILTYLLVGCIVLCFVGSVLRRWKGRLVLGAAGVLALVAARRFYLRIADVADRFGMRVQGHAIATYGGFAPTEVSARLRTGFYLVIASGLLCLLASILHEKIRLRSG
jgi:hypothetical protein